MDPIVLAAAAVVLSVAVVAGTVVHELSHALALRALGVPCDVEWLPARGDAGALAAGVRGRWATVTPRALPEGVAPWRLRIAALAPLLLAGPFLLVPAGALPDPTASGLLPAAAAVGWLACAIPSPQDFSLVWYAERAVADDRRRAGFLAEDGPDDRRPG